MSHDFVCGGLLHGMVIVLFDVTGSSGLYHRGIMQTSAKVRFLLTPSTFGFFPMLVGLSSRRGWCSSGVAESHSCLQGFGSLVSDVRRYG